MKRLAVFVAIGLVFSLVLAGNSTAVQSKYPAFAAVFTNVSQIDFFTGTTGGSSAIGAASLPNYYPATNTGFTNCVNTQLASLASSGNTYTINGTGGTPPAIKCDFYPNAVTKSGFSVGGWTSLTTKQPAAQPDDGELLVITNSGTFTVSASISGTVAGGMTLYAIPGYLATDNNFYKPDQSTSVTGSALSAISLDQTYAFSTQYGFAKIIPIVFYAETNPLTSTATSTLQSATITWNGVAP